MVHTIQLYIGLTEGEKKTIERYHGKRFYRVIKEIEGLYKDQDITMNFKKYEVTRTYNIYFQTDVINLLGKKNGIIDEGDYEQVSKIIEDIEKRLLLHEIGKKFILIRIDYRLDIVVENKHQREYLFKLWNKLTAKYYHLKKCNRKKKNENDIEPKPFKTTLYFNSKSICITVYDKEKERKDKGLQVNSYEENVLRFEVRLMNNHLKNMKYAKKREKTLEEYWRKEVYMGYMEKYVIRLFGTDDFYKIYYARKLIRESEYPEKEQKKLETFLIDVSKYGVEGVIGYRTKLEWDYKQYSRYQIKKYGEMLKILGINMILVPQNEVAELGIVPNPLNAFKEV